MEPERDGDFLSDGMANLEQDFIVPNKLGIHARVAAQIVKVASQFDCELWVVKDGNKVNAKSILDLMSLMCPQGTRIKVLAQGKDAAVVLSAVAGLFQTKFGES
jgi:phosphocarrier protein